VETIVFEVEVHVTVVGMIPAPPEAHVEVPFTKIVDGVQLALMVGVFATVIVAESHTAGSTVEQAVTVVVPGLPSAVYKAVSLPLSAMVAGPVLAVHLTVVELMFFTVALHVEVPFV